MDSTSDNHLDIPPIEVSHCVKVTTIAAEPKVPASLAGIRGSPFLPPSYPWEMKRLQRWTRHFTETDIKDFAAFLEQGMAESVGLVLVVIENWQNWAVKSIIDAFPSFPVQLLHGVNGGLSLTMLPAFDDDKIDLCYVMDNIDVTNTPERVYSRGSIRLGLWEAQRIPIAAWLREVGTFPRYHQRAVTVVFGGSSIISVSDRLFRHYDSIDLRRWKRLNGCPYWMYLDSFFVFTNWDSTLEAVRFYFESKERDMFSFDAQSPIFHQTRELHRDASTTLVLQESLRMHRASLKAFQLVISRLPPSTSLRLIQRRLEDITEQLEFYQSTCITVLEQQRNLLNMTFNLETIGQSQTVMRLNGLAFVFLPPSFIASIFGMTTIAVPAVWYIAVALPTLIATVGAVFIINRATDYLQSRMLKKRQSDYSNGHTGIDRNAPRSWLANITNTKVGGSTSSNMISLDKTASTSPWPPSQKQLEPSLQIFGGHSLVQQQSDPSTLIPDRPSSGQQQSEASTNVIDRQSSDQQQPKPSTYIPNQQSPGQKQLETSIRIFDEQFLHQQQPSSGVLNTQSPGQQQLKPSTRIFDFQFQGQQQPPIGVLNRRFKRALDSNEVYVSRTIPLERPKSPGEAYDSVPKSPEDVHDGSSESSEDVYGRPRRGRRNTCRIPSSSPERTYGEDWRKKASSRAHTFRVKGGGGKHCLVGDNWSGITPYPG